MNFDQMYREHAPFVRRFITKLMFRYNDNDSDIDDLVQETFYQAIRSYHSFNGESKLTTWLCGIAVHQIHNKSRSLRRRRETAMDDFEDFVDTLAANEYSDPAKLIEARNLIEKLIEFLNSASMSARHAQVYMMLMDDSTTYQDVADELGIPIGTVRSRMFRAREAVKEIVS